MNGVVAILQLRPILSHETRRLPNRSINKTEFQRLRGNKSAPYVTYIRTPANCLKSAINGMPRRLGPIQT
jgi:hypothetical protein